MSLLNDTRTRVEQHFWDKMAEARPGMFIKFENRVGNNPSDKVWCALSMRTALRESRGLGYEGPRATGLVFVQCFGPLGNGTKDVEDLADVVSEFFDGVRLDTTSFRATQVLVLGEVEGWYQINLNIEFVTD